MGSSSCRSPGDSPLCRRVQLADFPRRDLGRLGELSRRCRPRLVRCQALADPGDVQVERAAGRARSGNGLVEHGHRKTTTLIAGLRMSGMVAPMVLDGRINGDWFEAYVAQVLVPELRWTTSRAVSVPPSASGSKQPARACCSFRPTAPT
jgi:hypothetical protein